MSLRSYLEGGSTRAGKLSGFESAFIPPMEAPDAGADYHVDRNLFCSRSLMTPTWAKPFAEPPPRTRATFGSFLTVGTAAGRGPEVPMTGWQATASRRMPIRQMDFFIISRTDIRIARLFDPIGALRRGPVIVARKNYRGIG